MYVNQTHSVYFNVRFAFPILFSSTLYLPVFLIDGREEAKLKQWAKGELKKILLDDDKEVNFTDIWIEDSNKLLKNEIVFDPNPIMTIQKITIVSRGLITTKRWNQ